MLGSITQSLGAIGEGISFASERVIEQQNDEKSRSARLASGYELIAQALVHDDLSEASSAALDLAKLAELENTPDLSALALTVSRAESLESARSDFKALSEAMIILAGNHGSYVTMVCPMVKDGRWLQSAFKTANPYMGQRMPTCGRPLITIHPDGTQANKSDECCGS